MMFPEMLPVVRVAGDLQLLGVENVFEQIAEGRAAAL